MFLNISPFPGGPLPLPPSSSPLLPLSVCMSVWCLSVPESDSSLSLSLLPSPFYLFLWSREREMKRHIRATPRQRPFHGVKKPQNGFCEPPFLLLHTTLHTLQRIAGTRNHLSSLLSPLSPFSIQQHRLRITSTPIYCFLIETDRERAQSQKPICPP